MYVRMYVLFVRITVCHFSAMCYKCYAANVTNFCVCICCIVCLYDFVLMIDAHLTSTIFFFQSMVVQALIFFLIYILNFEMFHICLLCCNMRMGMAYIYTCVCVRAD